MKRNGKILIKEISKNKIKRLVSLQQKKYRQIHNLFVVEGIKQVNELLLSNFKVVQVVATSENRNKLTTDIIEVVSVDEMKKISSYKTPPGAIAVVEINQNPTISINAISKLLVLDDIADPGNLGTLIRSADWFGFDAVICSSNTVDCYNSKVIQSTMGSIFRIPVLYKELIPFFKSTLMSLTFSLLGFPLYYLFTTTNKNEYKIGWSKSDESTFSRYKTNNKFIYKIRC